MGSFKPGRQQFMIAEQVEPQDEEIVLKAVVLISQRKRYQLALVVFLGVVLHIMNIGSLSPAILFANPSFQCEGTPGFVGEEEACPILDFCTIKLKDTLTAKLGLYCDRRKDDRNLIQSVSGVGNVLGVMLVNWLADRKGKRFCIILALLLASGAAYCFLFGILQSNLMLIMVSQFLMGFAYGAYGTLIFFLGSRFLSDMSQYMVLIFYLCGTGTAQLSIALLNEFLGWEAYVAIYTGGFTAAVLVAPWVVKEDPVYLYNNGEMDALNQLVEQVGRVNGATVQQMQLAENELARINKNRGKRTPHITELIPAQMRSVRVVVLILVMACCSFTTNSVYFGIGFQIDSFGLSMTHSLLVFGSVEIVNYLLTMAVMAYLPSIKSMLYLCSLLPTLFCLAFLAPLLRDQTLQVIATAVVRFLITTYGCFYITYYVANLPKQAEGSAAGLIEGLGSLGKVAAPYVVQMSNDRGISSMGVFGGIYFAVGFLPLLFLPREGALRGSEDSLSDSVK